MDTTPEHQARGSAVVRVLAAVLDKLVEANTKLAPSDPGPVTKFHALRPPGICVLDYLERIHKYASCSTECFVLALVYIDRLIQRNNFALTALNVHRIIITSVMLGAKFFDDQYFNNAYYAKVGGVPCNEMNSLELEFLFRINFSLHVTTEAYAKYHMELTNHARRCISAEAEQALLQMRIPPNELRAQQQPLRRRRRPGSQALPGGAAGAAAGSAAGSAAAPAATTPFEASAAAAHAQQAVMQQQPAFGAGFSQQQQQAQQAQQAQQLQQQQQQHMQAQHAAAAAAAAQQAAQQQQQHMQHMQAASQSHQYFQQQQQQPFGAPVPAPGTAFAAQPAFGQPALAAGPTAVAAPQGWGAAQTQPEPMSGVPQPQQPPPQQQAQAQQQAQQQTQQAQQPSQQQQQQQQQAQQPWPPRPPQEQAARV